MDEMQKLAGDLYNKLNDLFGNVVRFENTDITLFDDALKSTADGEKFTFSYMTCIFYSQFMTELYVGMLVSKRVRDILMDEIVKEAGYSDPIEYWHDDMKVRHFGMDGVDSKSVAEDLNQILGVAEEAYIRLAALNEWYGTEAGAVKLDEYCLTNKAIKDVKRIILQLPYLMRRFDHDKDFAQMMMRMVSEIALGIGEEKGE